MCNFSDIVGAIFGQIKEKIFHSIYYASKTLNATQQNYILMEKEILQLVYAFDKFKYYLVSSKVIIYTNHVALRHSFTNKDTKLQLIR